MDTCQNFLDEEKEEESKLRRIKGKLTFEILLLGSYFDESSQWLLSYSNRKKKDIPESCSTESLNPQLYGKTITANKNETFKLIGKIHFKFSVEEKDTIKVKKIKIKGLSECQMNAGLYFR